MDEERVMDEERYSGRLTLRMPRSLHREVFQTALAERVSMNQLICVALASSLERMNQEPARAEPSQYGPDFDSIMGSMGYDEVADG